MAVKHYDIVLLTQKEYVNPEIIDPYVANILLEDRLLTDALVKQGLKVTRTSWDDLNFDWESADYALFRATWDYFHRFNEFHEWLTSCKDRINFINPYLVIQQNMDKHYLGLLQQKGVNTPPTIFLEARRHLTSLKNLFDRSGWKKAILKPAIAGGARHTYLLDSSNVDYHEGIFQELIAKEAMLLQEFQERIISQGEVSFMLFGGKFSHAVLKKPKSGDFRVQDDFGGSVVPYSASSQQIKFAEFAVRQCGEQPVYARADVMWDNRGQLCLSELEMIEPELWFRSDKNAPDAMARAVLKHLEHVACLSGA